MLSRDHLAYFYSFYILIVKVIKNVININISCNECYVKCILILGNVLHSAFIYYHQVHA